jgi:hypothetical protein
VAMNDPETNPKPHAQGPLDRYRAGNSSNYLSFAIGAVIIGGMLYLVFGDDVSDRTTLPPTMTTVPQTTSAPATK